MRVRSATTPHHPLVFSWAVFNSSTEPFDFISIPNICAHVSALYITVSTQNRDQSRALTAISCCPNLRTLAVHRGIPGRRKADEDPVPPWPTTLHLPHLSTLRIDPRLSAPFTSFLLSHCSNIEHLTLDSTRRPLNAWMRVVSPPQEVDFHPLPNLRTLAIMGKYRALHWCNERINLGPSDKLLKVSTPFRPGDQLSELVGTRSSCRLDVTVEWPLNDSRCVLHHLSNRTF